MSAPKSIVYGDWDEPTLDLVTVGVDPTSKKLKSEALSGRVGMPQLRRWLRHHQGSPEKKGTAQKMVPPRSPAKKTAQQKTNVSPRKSRVREALLKRKAEAWRSRDERVKHLEALRAMPRKGPPLLRVAPPSPKKQNGPSMVDRLLAAEDAILRRNRLKVLENQRAAGRRLRRGEVRF
ncbi:hypothetical protein C8J57DRAFT_1514767 [Mycena rebaudengoi]|nr:hypothetical protein C8J57DRAFT_1514767 [Mycena rebaudengoi]